MPDNLTTKECTKCGESYPATTEYFAPASRNKSGLHSWCRNCTRAGNRESQKKADKEKKRKKAKERYLKNREKILERQKKLRRERGDAERKRLREYYQKNRQYKIEQAREKRGSTKEDEDDYTDLMPTTDRDTFREWAVITSAEYGYILQKGVDSVAGDDVE